jgi:hypothetical protein
MTSRRSGRRGQPDPSVDAKPNCGELNAERHENTECGPNNEEKASIPDVEDPYHHRPREAEHEDMKDENAHRMLAT